MALTDKLTAVADAIRGKTGKSEPLTLDQMPGEIAGIVTGENDEDGFTLKFKVMRNASSLSGTFEGVKNIEIDMANQEHSIPAIQYLFTDKPGGKCTIRNIAGQNMPADMFRQAMPFSEISFEPYITPTTMTRFCYQGSYTPPLPMITIRGLRLDNLTGMSSAFVYPNSVTKFNVLWEGTLNNSISFDATRLTDESLALLIGCLADYSEGETHTLGLGTSALGRLTTEQITAATEKGWTLA